MKPGFLKESNGARNGSFGGKPPEQNPNFTQGGAAKGPFFSESELPIRAIDGAQKLPVKKLK